MFMNTGTCISRTQQDWYTISNTVLGEAINSVLGIIDINIDISCQTSANFPFEYTDNCNIINKDGFTNPGYSAWILTHWGLYQIYTV